MKHFLLASAAAFALLAAPALAQYTTTSPSPAAPTYSTPQTEPGYAMPQNDPAFADPAAPGNTVTPPITAAPPSAYDTPNVAAPQPGDTTAQADPSLDATQSAEADQNLDTQTQTAEADTAQTYPASADMAAMEEHAREAGMQGVPMSAAEVCQPRSVDFQQTRLTNDARHQLVAAVDRASACDMREVTIKASESRAAAVRRELIAAGVDESMITVEPGSGALEVDMAFNGVAASTPEFAAMYNGGTQTAALEPGQTESLNAPGATTSDQGYAPTTYQDEPVENPATPL